MSDDIVVEQDDQVVDPSWSIDFSEGRYNEFEFWRSSIDLLNRQPILLDRGEFLGDRNANGVPVRLPNGELIRDPYSWRGYVMAPVGADLAAVAEAGRELGASVSKMADNPLTAIGVGPALLLGLGTNLGHAGRFDYQREGSFFGGYTQHRQFRDISNINVGLLSAASGLSKEQTLSISGAFARGFSSNARPSEPHHLDPRTKYFIEVGYDIGTSGVFSRPPRTP